MCPKFILMMNRFLFFIQTSIWDTSYQQILYTETLQKTFVIYIDEVIGLLVTSKYVIAALYIVCIGLAVCIICIGARLGLHCKSVSEFKVAWRKIKRCIWGLPYKAHNAIFHNLSYDTDLQPDTRLLNFVHSCLTIVIECVSHCYQQNFTLLNLHVHLLQIINIYIY